MQSELFFDILKGSFHPISLHLAVKGVQEGDGLVGLKTKAKLHFRSVQFPGDKELQRFGFVLVRRVLYPYVQQQGLAL